MVHTPGVDNRFGFAGYLWDPFLQLYHVRHRVYDPMVGRWLQRDPIGVAGGWNLYEYVGGDPWGYTDPMGLAPECVCADGGQRSAPTAGQGSDKLRDANSFEFLDDYAQRYQAGGGSGGEKRFKEASAAIGAGLRVAVNTAGVAVMIVTPDPTDAVLFTVAAKYGVTTLSKVGGKIFGRTADGKEVTLDAADAAKAADALNGRQKLGRKYSSRTLRHNLEAVGIAPRGKGFKDDAHHIVGNSKDAAELRDRLKAAGIDINSADNGMWLDREFHRTLSSKEFRDEVIESFRGITDKDKLVDRLQSWREQLRKREAEYLREHDLPPRAGGCQQ